MRKLTPTEHEVQKTGVEWFKIAYPKFEKHLQASLNGVYLGDNKKTAAIQINKMKATGMVVGESDLFLAVPIFSINCAGLFIEVKTEDGHATEEQLAFIEDMTKVGYAAQICFGVDALIDAINEHMKRYFQEQKH